MIKYKAYWHTLRVGLGCLIIMLPFLAWQFFSQVWFPGFPSPWDTVLSVAMFVSIISPYLYLFANPTMYLALAATDDTIPEVLRKPIAIGKYAGIFASIAIVAFIDWYFQWSQKGNLPHILSFAQSAVGMLLAIYVVQLYLTREKRK